MGNYDDPRLTGADPPPRRSWWVLAGTGVLVLLLGLAAGYLLGARDVQDPPVAAAPTTTTPPPPATSGPPTTPGGGPPCLAAGEAGAAVLEQVREGVRAIGDLDPAALREVLNRLQPLQAELEEAVAACYGRVAPDPATTAAPPT
ncbi:hypothetical protein [Pseudonocardia nigra]|uniref:hypothetical protein n=1 Tax=Pseudonocardia nigra TaxID=1921578 RepID=UPI001C605B43|nr:hypothetical protein [Pseudonocardia nigra]